MTVFTFNEKAGQGITDTHRPTSHRQSINPRGKCISFILLHKVLVSHKRHPWCRAHPMLRTRYLLSVWSTRDGDRVGGARWGCWRGVTGPIRTRGAPGARALGSSSPGAAPPGELCTGGRSLQGSRGAQGCRDCPRGCPQSEIAACLSSVSFVLRAPAARIRRVVRGPCGGGAASPSGPAAGMRLPWPAGQRAAAASGTRVHSPLAGTPPWPALGSRGRRCALGPGAE